MACGRPVQPRENFTKSQQIVVDPALPHDTLHDCTRHFAHDTTVIKTAIRQYTAAGGSFS